MHMQMAKFLTVAEVREATGSSFNNIQRKFREVCFWAFANGKSYVERNHFVEHQLWNEGIPTLKGWKEWGLVPVRVGLRRYSLICFDGLVCCMGI